MGSYDDLKQWLDGSADKSVDDLLSLQHINRENHRQLDVIFSEIRKKTEKKPSPGPG